MLPKFATLYIAVPLLHARQPASPISYMAEPLVSERSDREITVAADEDSLGPERYTVVQLYLVRRVHLCRLSSRLPPDIAVPGTMTMRRIGHGPVAPQPTDFERAPNQRPPHGRRA